MESRRFKQSNSDDIRVETYPSPLSPAATALQPSVLLSKAADALRLARTFPVGPQRNELRQIAAALRKLNERGFNAAVMDRDTAIQMLRSTRH